MKEQNLNLEQPVLASLNAHGEGISQFETEGEKKARGAGSKMGKFKDVETFIVAYNNLQGKKLCSEN